MKFVIGSTEYFEKVGFNTEGWRKSADGTKALVHLEFARPLCDVSKLDVYEFDSKEFEALQASEEWNPGNAPEAGEVEDSEAAENTEKGEIRYYIIKGGKVYG